MLRVIVLTACLVACASALPLAIANNNKLQLVANGTQIVPLYELPRSNSSDIPALGKIQKVQKICIDNDAGFVLHWWMKDLVAQTQSKDSGSYPIDQTRCMDMGVLPQIEIGDVVMCTVHADLGETQDCATALQFDQNGYTATFTCTGTTLNYSCALNAVAHE